MAIYGDYTGGRAFDFGHLMHQRGLDIMRTHPLVLAVTHRTDNTGWTKLSFEYLPGGREGSIMFGGRKVYWTIQDGDLPGAGHYFFFGPGCEALVLQFKLTYG